MVEDTIEKRDKVIATLREYRASNPGEYISLDTFAEKIGLDRKLTKQDNKLRAIVQFAREEIKKIGYTVANRRNVGYRIAVGYDALDEKEKQCHRAYKHICAVQTRIFNKSLNEYDLEIDLKRKDQYLALDRFKTVLNKSIDGLRDALASSPFSKKASNELKETIEIEIAKSET